MRKSSGIILVSGWVTHKLNWSKIGIVTFTKVIRNLQQWSASKSDLRPVLFYCRNTSFLHHKLSAQSSSSRPKMPDGGKGTICKNTRTPSIKGLGFLKTIELLGLFPWKTGMLDRDEKNIT